MTAVSNVWRFAVFSDLFAELGESPVWSRKEDCVWWIDVTGKAILRTACADGRTERWPMPEQTGFLVLAHDGSPVVGLETGVFRFTADGGLGERVAPAPGNGFRYNDAAVDPHGRLYCGTIELAIRRQEGIIGRVEEDGTLTAVFDDLYIPNGLAFDPLNGRMYFSDSHPDVQTIWVCDYDSTSGSVSNRRVLDCSNDRPGRPDGGVVDSAGNYWIAGVDAGEIWCYSSEGMRSRSIDAGLDFPTKMTFGGVRGDQVFLTSKHKDGEGGFLCRASADVTGSVRTVRNSPDSA